VIAVDTNILVAVLRSEYEHHERAAARVRELAEGSSPWALPWPCVHELLAVVTNPRIFREPLSPQHAADAIDALLESPTARLIAEADPAATCDGDQGRRAEDSRRQDRGGLPRSRRDGAVDGRP
jgi:predicted nucleic acid-binding protein